MTLNRSAGLATLIAGALLAAFLVACAGEPEVPTAAPQPTAESMPATAAPAAATTAPDPTAAPAPTETLAPAEATPATETPTEAPTEPPPTAEAMSSGAAAVFTLGEGTIARYRVEEELANTGFFVAVGETQDVAGSITFDESGEVVAEDSRIVVQAATLRTDSGRRDGYVRNRTLETDTYPEVVFVPTSIEGLPESLADTSGQVHVQIIGDLTVKDQTREVTWDGEIDFAGDGAATGSVAVEFTFDDFGMNKPRVAIVLSVEDTIRLELDFVGAITAQ
ncbi:MAG: YceI family protein [Chloroflexota bacterium]|nr:YceI family protein [Chloroflexota bacterium]MDE2684386.1 YceI family protein [Chloroflexota bacterium]